MFGAFTYIAFTVTRVSGFAQSSVPWLLILLGVGLFAGNKLGGRAADRTLIPSLAASLSLLTVVLEVFALTAHSKFLTIIVLVLMGAAGFAPVPALQPRITRYAQDAPTMAPGSNIGAFNVGNTIGPLLSGLAIGAWFGFTSPLWAGALLTVIALIVVCVATAASHRTRRQPATTSWDVPGGERLGIACHDCARVAQPEHNSDDRRHDLAAHARARGALANVSAVHAESGIRVATGGALQNTGFTLTLAIVAVVFLLITLAFAGLVRDRVGPAAGAGS